MTIRACVFAKPPVPGLAKTRLIPALGAEAAAELAAHMLCDVWQTVASCSDLAPVLAAACPGALPIPPDAVIWPQGDGGLGVRLQTIFDRALGSAQAGMAIGADSPTLSASHLQRAVAELQRYDAVIGPSLDGGFYLLALRRCPAGLFENIPWSTSSTRAALQARLHQHGLSHVLLHPLFDVDEPDDLELLRAALQADGMIAPATRRWLAAQCS